MASSTAPTPISVKLYYDGETRKFSLALKDLAVGTFGEKVRFLSLPFPHLIEVIMISLHFQATENGKG